MKTRNVDLKNTPLLTNNICKFIYLEAPTLLELKKKTKEYEILLVRALTNVYRLLNLSLDKNGHFTMLPNGNYEASIFLNFYGKKKAEITNPEKTLEYIKHLTAMESKKPGVHVHKTIPKQKTKDYHKIVNIPIELKPEDTEFEVISKKQRQILEQLIADANLIKISFFVNKNSCSNNTSYSLKVEYEYREILEIPEGPSDLDDTGNR